MSAAKSTTSSMALAALGVVYGDIGTSPLYTMKEIFGGAHHPVPITSNNILGILSVVFWSMTIVISLKYVTFIMRADNKGEGGIMALMALVRRYQGSSSSLMLMGLFGTALFYGDSVLTPAISIMSAVEGLSIATPAFGYFEIPISLIILVLLFFAQKNGTHRIGILFGPIMVFWFITLGLLGLVHIMKAPEVLGGLNPVYAFRFFTKDPAQGFFSLGATVLALTGGEALYADMGHFGRKPVQIAWFGVVLPGLLLNYYGQGALLLKNPSALENPFYHMAPAWALYPLVALSTMATVIASQAVISGAYSLTSQAMQLGYVPRMDIQQTSQRERGQIYLPAVNWLLLAAVALLVMGFGSSSSLAAAYGIAVTGTMVITTLLSFIVVRHLWHWGLPLSIAVVGFFLAVDLAYFSSNLTKILLGGWFPLVLGGLIFLLMSTWKRGRELLSSRLARDALPLKVFVEQTGSGDIPQIPGTAVFLTSHLDTTPHALLHSLKHYRSLHQHVVILAIKTQEDPYVADSERLQLTRLNEQFFQLRVNFGFMDKTDLPAALALCSADGPLLDMMTTTFFLGRETLIPKAHSELALWRERLFVAMYRNASSAFSYFLLPPNRVVELGTQIVL